MESSAGKEAGRTKAMYEKCKRKPVLCLLVPLVVAWLAYRHFSRRPANVTWEESLDDLDGISKQLEWPRVVFLGDSLTQYSFSEQDHWGALIANKLQRTADVLNRGFSGYTAGMIHALLPQLAPTFGRPVVAITIMVGTTDAFGWVATHAVSKYKMHLTGIVDYLQVKACKLTNISLKDQQPT